MCELVEGRVAYETLDTAEAFARMTVLASDGVGAPASPAGKLPGTYPSHADRRQPGRNCRRRRRPLATQRWPSPSLQSSTLLAFALLILMLP